MTDFEAKAREVRGEALRASYGNTGWNIAMVTKEVDARFAVALREAYAAGRRDENEACAKAAAGPDEGYLHGCSCRSRINARRPNATQTKETK